jgi:hypothetical protein
MGSDIDFNASSVEYSSLTFRYFVRNKNYVYTHIRYFFGKTKIEKYRQHRLKNNIKIKQRDKLD